MRYEEVSEYVQGLVGEGNELLRWLHKKSAELQPYGVFPIDPTSGRLLELLARAQSAKRVLEVGSGAGYSALWFMQGMNLEGTLDAIEYNPEVIRVLRSVVRKAGLERRIKIHRGPALRVLEALQGPYDVVFIDADKDEYPDYLEHALRMTHPGSLILADNMLWHGATVKGDKGEEGARGIMEYTRRIFHDERLSSLIIPLGDGIAVSWRIK